MSRPVGAIAVVRSHMLKAAATTIRAGRIGVPKLAVALALALMLSGCLTSTRIQGDYVTLRDQCRRLAERNYQQYAPKAQSQSRALRTKDQNAVLAQIFSECMYYNGWTVAAPGRGHSRDDLPFLTSPRGRQPGTAAAPAPSKAEPRQRRGKGPAQPSARTPQQPRRGGGSSSGSGGLMSPGRMR